MRRLHISDSAIEDLRSISDYTWDTHGPDIHERYIGLLQTALSDLGEDPDRLGVRESVPGFIAYHLKHSKRTALAKGFRIDTPRHVVFFRVPSDGVVEIVRILHDSMDWRRHLKED